MDGLWHVLEIMAICVGVLVALAAILLLIVSRLPDSPLKQVMRAFSNRVSATAALALVGLPLQPIPEVDGIYDIGGLIVLGIYWWGMADKIRMARGMPPIRRPGSSANILQLMQLIRAFRRRR